MARTEESYIGVGKVWAGKKGKAKVHVGNVEKLDLSVEEDTKKLMDKTAQGGGVRNRVSTITGVTVDMTWTDFYPDNLAIAVFGNAATVAAGTVTDEPHTAFTGGLIRLAHINATSVVVKSGDGATTYVVGSDYTLSAAGIVPLSAADGGAIPDDSPVKVSYSHPAQSVVEAITESGAELEVTFDGMNEAQSGKPVVVDIHRLRMSPGKGLSLIGSDFAKLEMKGEALSDATKGVGKSRYFVVTQ
jgi:hypothetical protein